MMYDAISSLFTDKGKSEDKAEAMFKRYSIDTAKKYGEGGYGATFPAIDNETKEAMAVKVIDTRRMKLESILKECTMLECLNHPNVIKIKDHGLGRKATGQDHLYYIFMELASGGELFDQVRGCFVGFRCGRRMSATGVCPTIQKREQRVHGDASDSHCYLTSAMPFFIQL